MPARGLTCDPQRAASRRLCVYNGGFLLQPRLRRILTLAGYDVSLGLPDEGDLVGVWGRTPTSRRGEAVARRRGAGLVRIEDAFLRSLHPGRTGEPTLGLLIDHGGVHFDAGAPSDLETLLATHPLDDAALLERAQACMAWMRSASLSKYAATDPDLPTPEPGYVLVVDQTRGDASVLASGADRARFVEMLACARRENPGRRIVLKTHPETTRGLRAGHFTGADAGADVLLIGAPLSPWALLQVAHSVYTVSSQLGFEAILAGHRPRVFGTPFYAGWGLSDDRMAHPRRTRRLSPEQLFTGAMILYPTWYDPFRDTLCEIETVLAILESGARAWREDRAGWVGCGMRLWKRKPLQQFFGQQRRMLFENERARCLRRASQTGRGVMIWAGKANREDRMTLVEDGFLRSRGLGAELIPPLSLVCDDIGMHYDPSRPSRLEALISRAVDLRPEQLRRAEALIRQLVDRGLTKYNLDGAVPDLPEGHRILVTGQVEDDASVVRGSPEVRTNAALLARTRAANPGAVILWKPHPDVQAGLRKGDVENADRWADVTLGGVDMAALLPSVNEVWTLTSLTGFEALLRGCEVVTLGVPFYAGWGLTRDLGPVPARRKARPSLPGLVHAALIDYPRYRDPVTGMACPVEVVAERLANGEVPLPGPFNRSLSKLQGLLASRAHLWRR